jgi:hypothetical protein
MRSLSLLRCAACRSLSAARYVSRSCSRRRLDCCRRLFFRHVDEHTFCLAPARTSG